MRVHNAYINTQDTRTHNAYKQAYTHTTYTHNTHTNTQYAHTRMIHKHTQTIRAYTHNTHIHTDNACIHTIHTCILAHKIYTSTKHTYMYIHAHTRQGWLKFIQPSQREDRQPPACRSFLVNAPFCLLV